MDEPQRQHRQPPEQHVACSERFGLATGAVTAITCCSTSSSATAAAAATAVCCTTAATTPQADFDEWDCGVDVTVGHGGVVHRRLRQRFFDKSLLLLLLLLLLLR